MNYLAHILLSCEDEELLIGNFLGDFIKNKEVITFSEGIQKGVRLHRLIDSYTDSHPVVKKGIRRLQKRHSKYAGVVIDVLYDYILAKNWANYGPGDLQGFSNNIYEILGRHISVMPTRIQDQVERMIAANWLVSYSKLEGIKYTFERVRKRASIPSFFDGVMDSLVEDEKLLTEEFALFFPDIMKETTIFCDC